ncbi:pickpocket protein 28-like isoform X3 [Daphnia pulex]|nr:pickpocket protein 28-like isoform X3 [Daphnia pulex]
MKRNRSISQMRESQGAMYANSRNRSLNQKEMAEITDAFLRNTSIHGMRYIGQRNRPIFERIFWMLLVVVGCVISVYGCYLEWIKWSDSSILITRDPSVTTHDPINFPVMTICSTNKISSSKLEAVINEPKYSWMNYSSMVMAIRYLTKFDGLVSNTEDDNFQHLLHELNERNIDIEDLVEVIHQVHPRCSDMIVDCQWKSSVVSCGRLLSLRMTDDGFCCSIDVGVFDRDDENGTTGTVYDYGVHSAFRIILDPNVNDNVLSTISIDGFKILLHNKDEFPDVIERGFIVGSGYENYVALNSYSVSYTPVIPSVSFEKRQCYVEGEGKLKYNLSGLIYTRSSCLFECRTEKILEECQCLPYFIKVNVSVPSCRLQSYPCVVKFYVRSVFMASIANNCRCPATCKDQWFTTQISSAPLSLSGFSSSRTFQRISRRKNVDANYSVKLIGLRIFFKYNAGDSFSMDVPFGNKELIASIGGILGLGLGFSMISAIELCYFLCCGWCFRKRRRMSESTDNWVLLGDVQFPIKHKRSHQPKKIPDIPVKRRTIVNARVNTISD